MTPRLLFWTRPAVSAPLALLLGADVSLGLLPFFFWVCSDPRSQAAPWAAFSLRWRELWVPQTPARGDKVSRMGPCLPSLGLLGVRSKAKGCYNKSHTSLQCLL